MASNEAVARAVSDVYAAARAVAGPVEARLLAKALADVADDELEGAVRRLVAAEEWNFGRKPSPGLVLEWVAIERSARRAKAPPPPPAPPTPAAAVAEGMAQVRAARAAGIRARLREQA